MDFINLWVDENGMEDPADGVIMLSQSFSIMEMFKQLKSLGKTYSYGTVYNYYKSMYSNTVKI